MIKHCEILANCDLPDHPSPGYRVERLVGDASTRSYFRITTPAGETMILMKMPEPFDERQFPYLDNYHLLRGQGIPVAEIERMEPSRGYVFLQDLGDMTLYELYGGWSEQGRLSRLLHSVDLQVRISRIQPASKLAFDTEKLSWELNFFLENFLVVYRGCALSEDETAELKGQFVRLAGELAARPGVFCHRDFHSRNLMLAGETMYVIDFQDARLGPATYDLASLCYDSYLQHPRGLIEYLERYFFTFHPDAETQRWEYPRMRLQRNLKALGTFGYQAARLGRSFYVQFVDPTLGYVRKHLESLPEYSEMSKLLARHLPELS